MDNNRTLIIMAVISVFFILYLWIIQPRLLKNQNVEQQIVQEETENQKDIYLEEKPGQFKTISNDYEIISSSQSKSYDLIYENKNIKIEFDPKDAVIKHAWVKDTFLQREKHTLYDLVQGEKGEGALQVKLGSWENEVTLGNIAGGKNLYNYQRVGDSFIFSIKFRDKKNDITYTIEKKYTFIDNENLFKLDINIFNNKNASLSFDNSDIAYSIGWGPLLGIESRDKKSNKRQINTISYFNGKKIINISEKHKIFKTNGSTTEFAEKFREGDESWIASNGHYFAALIYPDNQNYKYFFDYREKEKKNVYCGFSRTTNKSRINSTFYIYLGPKINSILKKYNTFVKDDFMVEKSNISKLDGKIIFGIGNIIGVMLEWIYKVVKNYGLAIILLTIIIKLMLFPLTFKSMASQQKMSSVQPKIKELQEKFKDKPEVLNKETMSLYKKEGINPLGGCLPMLLQMPILIAMYQLLNKMVVLKGAHFLWIKDLSKPDAVVQFPFTIPMANISTLNVLPLLMVATQVFSSLLMPDAKTNKQAQLMMWMMPLFFFFIFYNVSSGLVLYWTIMNILNLGQQLYMRRFHFKKTN